MTRTRFLVAALVLLAVTADCAAQTTILVPDDFPDIQTAIGASQPGGVILVSPGTYTGPINIDRVLTVRSTMGAAVTHIQSSLPVQLPLQAVVHIDAPSPGVIFEGFTVRFCNSSAIATRSESEINDCIIRENSATAVLVLATTVMNRCIITDNSGKDGDVINSSTGCNGISSGLTGGMLAGARASCFDCLFARNTGGNATPVSFPCTGPPGNGGAGAISSGGAIVTLVNCTVTENVGGMTIFGSRGAGGLRYFGDGPVLRNTVAQGNLGADYQDDSFPFPFWLPPDVGYSNVGGYTGPGAGNIDADPLFLDPMNRDYRLTSASPCRDAGDHTIPNLPLVDLDGVPRIVGPNVDMGCYEFVQPLPGTDEGLELRTTIDGEGADLHRKFAPGGSDLIASIEDDLGVLAGAVPVLLGQVFGNDTPPTGIPSFPLHLDFPGLAVFHDGNATPGPLIGAIPVAFGPVTMPPGLGGLTLRLQAFGLSASASNATHAATHGRDLEFR